MEELIEKHTSKTEIVEGHEVWRSLARHNPAPASMKSFVTSSKVHSGRIIEKLGVGSVLDFVLLAEKAGIKPTKG